jgi:thioredoxin
MKVAGSSIVASCGAMPARPSACSNQLRSNLHPIERFVRKLRSQASVRLPHTFIRVQIMFKTIIRCLTGGCLLLAFSLAFAGTGLREFKQTQFDSLIAQRQPVIVYFHATWCPTCKVQEPIVERLKALPKFKSVTFFNADYDTQLALKKTLHVTQQSTFVVFKDGHEVARSTGETTPQAIETTFDKAL